MPPPQPGEHLIASFVGDTSGPTLIVIGSIHGNEPAGSIALDNVADQLTNLTERIRGRVYFLRGNTRALACGRRFVEHDLNRIWTSNELVQAGCLGEYDTSELRELSELDHLFDSILITAMDEVFIVDLHSTSANGIPFATVGDTLRNRSFAKKFPTTILLGIEEQLDGTMLEYLNNAGAVTLGFEGGQHLATSTVSNHEAVIWHALAAAGVLDISDVPEPEIQKQKLDAENRGPRLYEVRYRHAITEQDEFEMKPGFKNFDPVPEGMVLANDKNGVIRATESGLLLMPLYQKLGNDGFFIGREISPFWLRVSGLLRGVGIQKIMHFLPGVERDPVDPGTLIVNTNIARLFPLQLFHLLGFRRIRWTGKKLVVSRRRHDTSGPFKWKVNVGQQ